MYTTMTYTDTQGNFGENSEHFIRIWNKNWIIPKTVWIYVELLQFGILCLLLFLKLFPSQVKFIDLIPKRNNDTLKVQNLHQSGTIHHKFVLRFWSNPIFISDAQNLHRNFPVCSIWLAGWLTCRVNAFSSSSHFSVRKKTIPYMEMV